MTGYTPDLPYETTSNPIVTILCVALFIGLLIWLGWLVGRVMVRDRFGTREERNARRDARDLERANRRENQ